MSVTDGTGGKLTDPEPKRGYPYMSTSAWAELRKKLRGSVPKIIDRGYLHTVLGISNKAAANLFPQLGTIGLIDDENTPTDLVYEFRDDDMYSHTCQEIVGRVYPSALTDEIGNPAEEVDAVVRWFIGAALLLNCARPAHRRIIPGYQRAARSSGCAGAEHRRTWCATSYQTRTQSTSISAG